MGKRRYRQVNELLQRLRSADPEWRSQAARRLGYMHDRRARAALIGALNDVHPRVRAWVVLALWRSPKCEHVHEAIALLSDPEEQVRALAARFAADLIGTEAAPILVRLLRDPCGRVRSTAVTSLGKLDEVSALPILRPLIDDADPWMRAGVCWALGKLGDRSSLEVLAARATQDEDAYTRYQAAEALLCLGDPRGRETLERMSEAGDAPGFMSVERFREEVSQLLAESDGSG
jgi:HEAT repeat protein